MKKIWVPGSKSITNRALILAALSEAPVTLEGVLDSDDSRYMQAALKSFGVGIETTKKNTLLVTPPKKLKAKGQEIFIGNAGTAARFLSGISLVVEGEYALTGVDRMKARPQKDLFETLGRDLGVDVECLENEGFLPARFGKTKRKVHSSEKVTISGKISSQFLSGLLLVGAKVPGGLQIEVEDSIPSLPYIKMTVELLKIWGIEIEVSEDWMSFHIKEGLKAPQKYQIPSDMSSASYPLLWSVLRGAPICIENFGSKTLQGDERFLEVIKKAGAKITRQGDKCTVEPPKTLSPIGDWNWETMPDVSMTGMILATFCPGTSVFTGLESLRVKECDRIVAMEPLKQFGVAFEIDGDVVTITGAESLKIMENPLKIDSFDDHRIAMCFGILKSALDLGADPYQESLIKISEPECVAKTWPDFWLELADWENQLRSVSALVLHRIGTNCGKNKYLIVKKPRKEHAWQFPQGGVDTGETLREAAIRELQEECGSSLNVKIKGERSLGSYKYFFPKDFDRHDSKVLGAQVHFFMADYLEGKVEVDQNEIIDFAWATEEEFENYFEVDYLSFVKSLI